MCEKKKRNYRKATPFTNVVRNIKIGVHYRPKEMFFIGGDNKKIRKEGLH